MESITFMLSSEFRGSSGTTLLTMKGSGLFSERKEKTMRQSAQENACVCVSVRVRAGAYLIKAVRSAERKCCVFLLPLWMGNRPLKELPTKRPKRRSV